MMKHVVKIKGKTYHCLHSLHPNGYWRCHVGDEFCPTEEAFWFHAGGPYCGFGKVRAGLKRFLRERRDEWERLEIERVGVV